MGSKDIFNGFTQEQYLQYIVNKEKNEICQKVLTALWKYMAVKLKFRFAFPFSCSRFLKVKFIIVTTNEFVVSGIK